MSNILIVEDRKDFRQAVRGFLKVSNVNVNLLEASTSEVGVELAKRTRPDIVLMDFGFRGINGIQAAAEIKASVPECSIFLLTMFDLKSLKPQVDRQIINGFISKSELCEKLLPSIAKFMNTVVKV